VNKEGKKKQREKRRRKGGKKRGRGREESVKLRFINFTSIF